MEEFGSGNIQDNDVVVNFMGPNGLCDFVIFYDFSGRALGCAVVNNHNFSIPDKTVFCDYSHQSLHDKTYITRCIIGEERPGMDGKIIARVSSNGNYKDITITKEQANFVKFAKSKEELLVVLANESFSRMFVPEEEEQIAKKAI